MVKVMRKYDPGSCVELYVEPLPRLMIVMCAGGRLGE
jgi:hypothetical protein